MAKKVDSEEELNKLSEEFGVEEPKTKLKKDVVLESNANAAISVLEKKRRKLVDFYKNEEKIPVMISPLYAPYLSRVVRESVNGIVVEVPANGQTYKINKTHADHIIAKIKRIDAMIARQKRAGSVTENFERTPGELHI